MILKDYIELRNEEKTLKEKYKDITDKRAETLYSKFKTEWEEYLIDVFDILCEIEEGVERIRIGDYGFTFVLGGEFFLEIMSFLNKLKYTNIKKQTLII